MRAQGDCTANFPAQVKESGFTGMALGRLRFVSDAQPIKPCLDAGLAYLTADVPILTVDDLSLRLLRHHASAVRHQKFHGLDIVTVQVEGNA